MPRAAVALAVVALVAWLAIAYRTEPPIADPGGTPAPASPSATPPPPPQSQLPAPPSAAPLPGDRLLEGFGDPSTPPVEDLRKVHRLVSGYFSVIKDLTRHPIGGNADLAACLLGENINRQPFLRREHPAINGEGLLVDRWGTPLSVHPEAARSLTLRSAGPDREMYSDDDLVLLPDGVANGAHQPAR